MTAIMFIAILTGLWTMRELAVGILVWQRRREIRHRLRVERTQRHFAAARNALMELALADQIDVNSATFKYFYFLNTTFMRRPDEYATISAAIRNPFLMPHGSQSNSPVLRESETWSPAIKRDVVKVTADALNYIIIDYSQFWRWMYSLEKKTDPTLTPMKMRRRIASRMEASEVKKHTVMSEIRETQRQMYKLCAV